MGVAPPGLGAHGERHLHSPVRIPSFKTDMDSFVESDALTEMEVADGRGVVIPWVVGWSVWEL